MHNNVASIVYTNSFINRNGDILGRANDGLHLLLNNNPHVRCHDPTNPINSMHSQKIKDKKELVHNKSESELGHWAPVIQNLE